MNYMKDYEAQEEETYPKDEKHMHRNRNGEIHSKKELFNNNKNTSSQYLIIIYIYLYQLSIKQYRPSLIVSINSPKSQSFPWGLVFRE